MPAPIFTPWAIFDPNSPIVAANGAPALATDGLAINGATSITVFADPNAATTGYEWRLWLLSVEGAGADSRWGVRRGSASGALGTDPESARFETDRHATRAFIELTAIAGVGAAVTFLIVGVSQEPR